METWDAIRARRNVRRFTDRAIAPAELDRILEAGRRSPSSMNQQRWDFVVSVDRERLRALGDLSQWAGHAAGAAAAVALIIPVSDDPDVNESLEFDLGQAAMSMMLAAADLGIGSCHGAVTDQEAARRLLGLPAERSCDLLLSFGYPADRPLAPAERPKRRAFDDVVHRERW
jgi:nitroreductase